MYDITPIIEAVVTLIAVVITAVIIPYIKSKTTAQEQSEIKEWVTIAVSAAEQIYKGSGRGEEKKKYVLEWLNEHNITVDMEKIDALIEAAVYQLNQTKASTEVLPIETVAVKSLTITDEEGESNGN